MTTVYKSKIDTWLAMIVVAAMVMSLFAVAALFAVSPTEWWIVVITASIGVGLPMWLLLDTSYTVASDGLLIKGGPFKWHVPIAEISDITETSNPLASPALSLDRLRIDYGRGKSVMVSPRNKAAFMREIESLRQA